MVARLAVAAVGCDVRKTSLLLLVAGCSQPSAGEDAAAPRRFHLNWRSEATLLRATGIEIDAAGQTFTTAGDIHINPGMNAPTTYTTLEATWNEHAVEMRVNIYLHSDGVEWWSDEIRHYDGAVAGEWVTYKGDYFRAPVEMPFVGSLALPTLRLPDVFMTSFLRVTCTGAPYSVLAYQSGLELVAGGYFRLPMRLQDASCADIGIPAGARIEWSVDDQAIATVQATQEGFTSAGDFAALAPGSTMATITLRNAAGDDIAHQRLPVIVVAP